MAQEGRGIFSYKNQEGKGDQAEDNSGRKQDHGPFASGHPKVLQEGDLQQKQGKRQDQGVFLGTHGQGVAEKTTHIAGRAGPPGRGQSAAEIEIDGRDIEESGQNGHPLNDVGHRLGLNGMNGPEGRGQESDGPPLSFGRGLEIRRFAEPQGREKQDPCRKEMKGHVDEVITLHLGPAEIPVQGEGEPGYRPGELAFKSPMKQTAGEVEIQARGTALGLIQNVGIVIQMPRGVKGVAINEEDH